MGGYQPSSKQITLLLDDGKVHAMLRKATPECCVDPSRLQRVAPSKQTVSHVICYNNNERIVCWFINRHRLGWGEIKPIFYVTVPHGKRPVHPTKTRKHPTTQFLEPITPGEITPVRISFWIVRNSHPAHATIVMQSRSRKIVRIVSRTLFLLVTSEASAQRKGAAYQSTMSTLIWIC